MVFIIGYCRLKELTVADRRARNLLSIGYAKATEHERVHAVRRGIRGQKKARRTRKWEPAGTRCAGRE
jgi:hypothetical protein